jgi:glycosyltransferase involved in cell wall biosynthesis
MQQTDGKVSVIIPAYNAQKFLKDTIDSVKKQTYPDWEIIVVNDGSTDGTPDILEKEADPRIKMVHQLNGGVSSARNNGLKEAIGEYVVFLDADDLFTPEFIEARVNFLKLNPHMGFVGGLIESFPAKAPITRAVAEDPEKNILFFKPGLATIPSNYLFRRKLLLDNRLEFNIDLSSTADRFFILQVNRFANGGVIENENARLLYRIDSQSMSHNISPRLIRDNERFYQELVKADLLPRNERAKFKSLYFYSLGLGFAKVKNFKLFLKYFANSFLSAPYYFIKLVLKKMTL